MAQNIAQAYRQLSSQGANIVSLVIRCYDEIIASLYATVRAIERHDIEEKTNQLNRATTFISHLRNIIDFEKGGETALYLDRFYALAQRGIVQASATLSTEILRTLAADFTEVRNAWQQVEAPLSANPSSPTAQNFSPITPPQAPNEHPPRRSGWSA
ncbi:MAG TPA: flagellar export chaperone FliS [Terriglobia bacterium]|nr:flagellar export chaperone FliS [Terriglobia bacterium]